MFRKEPEKMARTLKVVAKVVTDFSRLKIKEEKQIKKKKKGETTRSRPSLVWNGIQPGRSSQSAARECVIDS